jgi:hypothetical protein
MGACDYFDWMDKNLSWFPHSLYFGLDKDCKKDVSAKPSVSVPSVSAVPSVDSISAASSSKDIKADKPSLPTLKALAAGGAAG